MALHTGQDLNSTRPGTVPIMGTFQVNLPLITSTTPTYSTVVLLTNVTHDHVVSLQDMGLVSGATANAVASTGRILFSVQPQDGQVTLNYLNTGATVNAGDRVYSYVATLIKPASQ